MPDASGAARGKHAMKVAEPSINEVFGEFLAEEQRRLAPRTFRRSEEVIGLLRDCLDGYAYESLPATERAFWEQRYDADETAGSYCNTFGPERIPKDLGSFLGYFMIRKVLGG